MAKIRFSELLAILYIAPECLGSIALEKCASFSGISPGTVQMYVVEHNLPLIFYTSLKSFWKILSVAVIFVPVKY